MNVHASLLVWLCAVSLLELVDPGIVSSRIPLPIVFVAVVLGLMVWTKGKPIFSKRARIALTVGAVLTTMVMLLSTVAGSIGGIALLAVIACAAGIAFWTLTASPYANQPLP